MIKSMIKKKNCPICKEKTNFFFEKKKEPIDYFPKPKKIRLKFKNLRLNLCRNCDHIFQSTKPSQKTIDQFYSNNNQYGLKTNNYFINLREDKKIERIINVLKMHSLKDKKIIDIGGYNGYFLKKIKVKKKLKFLLDPDKVCLKNNFLYKENITNSYLDKNFSNKYESFFDIVVSRHVIEHVLDPNKFVNNLNKILKQDSILIVETPSIEKILEYSKTREICHQHINYFSKKSLKILFKNFFIIKSYIDSSGDHTFIMKKNFNKQIKNFNKNKPITKENKYFKCFLNNINLRKNYFQNFLFKNKSEKTWLYGASTSIYDLFIVYKINYNKIEGILDTDRKKKNVIFNLPKKLKIYHYDDLKNIRNDNIIVISNSFKQIKKYLKLKNHRGKIINFYSKFK